jgi:DNA-binding transcriptional LysR family regulator
MKNATFRQLRVFSEVARQLSFAKAARALHLTPPAVTMQVRELEGHVGMPLFDRSGRSVTLTTAGEYMLVYARKMLATLKDVSSPATLVTRNAGSAHLFLEDQRGPVIVKPAQGSGGQAVTLVPPPVPGT